MEGGREKTRFNQRIQEGGLMREINQTSAWSYKGQDQMIHSQKMSKSKGDTESGGRVTR